MRGVNREEGYTDSSCNRSECGRLMSKEAVCFIAFWIIGVTSKLDVSRWGIGSTCWKKNVFLQRLELVETDG